ncbi:MAG: response regulator [Cystobacterineae bacterium]|nr:response regulator [Cystobacterineae bacterium]
MHIRILVVDDKEDSADYIKHLLAHEGYVADTLMDSSLTIEQLKAAEYHMVILDMMMPKMGGVEVLQRIREVDSDIAVIVATAYPHVDTAIASLKAAAADYVKKPIEPSTFLETVRRVLEAKGMKLNPEVELHKFIGRFIREGRARQGLTLKQLARRTGLSVSLLSQIERAESSASISSLYKIATALGVQMKQLFGEV